MSSTTDMEISPVSLSYRGQYLIAVAKGFVRLRPGEDIPSSATAWWDSPADGGIACPQRTGKMPVPTESCRQSDVIWENRYRLVSDVKGRASYGFTVVELIVVLVLIAIATIIGMQMAGDWTTSYQFDSFNLGLQAAVETARANAMALQKSVKLSMREAGDSDPVEERRFAQEEYFV